MMNPEIKVKELIDRFYQNSPEEFGTAKAMTYSIKMSLICVDEILSQVCWDNEKFNFYSDVKIKLQKL